ncbi:hypothetical protein EHQ05_04020 [Leptospira yasudae]|uniref:hypothetical protein n=1 Tax=Leptospira yasudae TaxID=2202201 RepID=UPI00108243EA|nr:hypothetical protein [Leptospira yasudae]TGK30134.1 hypothetical protein EHQ05_04020 [Leptospira yasudae]TGM04485.1 hypothetical protein EHQ86_14715 [Leptospira yasudae]
MQFLKNIRSSAFLSLGLFLPQFVILGIYFRKLYLKFITFCPNQNFLTWDPDARLVTSIRIAEAMRSLDAITVLKLIFDSPTWPVLRNIPEAFLVLMFGPGGTPVSLFTFVELILLFGIVPWILRSFHKNKSWIAAAILFPIVWAGLLQNPGFMHYSFSGMLEIQGGLFFLPAILAFWKLHRNSVENQEPDSPWFLFVSANLLFHTKYPYGYIFVFFGCLFLTVFRFQKTKTFLFVLLNSYQNASAKNFFGRIKWGALLPIVLSLVLLLTSILISKDAFPGKTKALLRYAGALLFWISISIVIWKLFYSKENKKEIDVVWKYFWTYVILPIGSWVLLHPDRFSSSSSTIQHAQGAGLLPGQGDESIFSLTYFQEMIENSFYAPYGGWILCAGLLFGIGFGIVRYREKREVSASFFLFLSIFVSILGLTLMTPNHQPRHIYHLYPALLIAIGIFCYEEFSKEESAKIFAAAVYSLFIMFTLGYWSWKNYSVWERTNLCFSGVDRSLFYTADDAEEFFLKEVSRTSVLWNLLPLEHHNRPDITLSFYRAGFLNYQNVREKRKKEEVEFLKARASETISTTSSPVFKEDWFIVAKSCEEIEGGLTEILTKELKFAKDTMQTQIRGACIVKILKN